MGKNLLLKTMLVMVAALAGSGCSGSWVVVKRATPDPFRGQKVFLAEPVSFEGVSIGATKSERSWLSDLVPAESAELEKQRLTAKFDAEKTLAAAYFQERLGDKLQRNGIELAGSPADGMFVIKPRVVGYQRGFRDPRGFDSAVTEIKMTVQLTDRAGNVLDEVRFTAARNPPMSNLEPVVNVELTMVQIADKVAEYLKHRVEPRPSRPTAVWNDYNVF